MLCDIHAHTHLKTREERHICPTNGPCYRTMNEEVTAYVPKDFLVEWNLSQRST